jgi:Icc protein
MSDTVGRQVNRRQFLTLGLAVAGGVVSLGPQRARGAERRKDFARWAFLSDLHVPAKPRGHFRGFYPYQNLQRVTDEIGANLPDGAVITGDLARWRGQIDAYGNVQSLLAPIARTRPIHMGIGNHDNRQNFLSMFAGGHGGGPSVEGRHVVTADAGPVRMIILDSLLFVSMFPGMLGKPQRAWLQTYLQICDDRPTILFLHHTPRADLLDTGRLFDIVAPATKVKAIVFGHSHKYKFSRFEGIHLINLPACGYNFTNRQPVGWVEAQLTAHGGEFTLHAIGGNTDENGNVTKLQWRA